MVGAFLLALPGAVCWVLFFQIVMFDMLDVMLGVLLLFWLVTIHTAIASLAAYWRAPKPWFVIVNWTINISGLLFTLFVLAILMVYAS
jgi:hypothetical protein